MGQNASSGHGCSYMQMESASKGKNRAVNGQTTHRSEEIQRRQFSCMSCPHLEQIKRQTQSSEAIITLLQGVGEKRTPPCEFSIEPANSVDMSSSECLTLSDSEADLFKDTSNNECAANHDRIMSREDIAFLQLTFESVKLAREYVGWRGMLGIFEQIPDVAVAYRTSPHMPIRKGDNWELMGQGITFLSGIERFLARLHRPERFRAYAQTLGRSHNKYRVPLPYVLTAVDIFQGVIIAHLTCHETPEMSAKIREVWISFFDNLRSNMALVMNDNTAVRD